MEEIIKDLEVQIQESMRFGDDPNEASWAMQTGIIITINEAISILEFIKSNSHSSSGASSMK